MPLASSPEPALPVQQPPTSVAVHWLSAGLIATAVIAVLLREWVDNEAWRAFLLSLHRQATLSVLALLLLRLVLRLVWPRQDGTAPIPMGLWMRILAMASHGAMYALLLLVPLLGWALSDARGQSPHWLGLLALPQLTPVDPDQAELLEDWHRWAAWGLGAMVSLHTAAALWHHCVRRDNVLRAMWPPLRRRTKTLPAA